ncbi:Hypothetical_protein [Hexamita inflata]|uniref:Hypothetical_protein n=1 Tax=Hexamita inflata TaxID=28002 RepID=A0AA86QCY3_9EUKA|nr:Hypothetical protein HINF_LOCUS42161 [Hexamita inflata]
MLLCKQTITFDKPKSRHVTVSGRSLSPKNLLSTELQYNEAASKLPSSQLQKLRLKESFSPQRAPIKQEQQIKERTWVYPTSGPLDVLRMRKTGRHITFEKQQSIAEQEWLLVKKMKLSPPKPKFIKTVVKSQQKISRVDYKGNEAINNLSQKCYQIEQMFLEASGGKPLEYHADVFSESPTWVKRNLAQCK